MSFNPSFFCGKMFQDCSVPIPPSIPHRTTLLKVIDGKWTQQAILKQSCPRWQTSGFLVAGEVWMPSISASLSADDGYSECSLADVLEPSVAPKYFLSPLACRGIIRRAAKRGKALPTQLGAALQAVASRHPEEAEKTIATSSLPQQSERLASARKGRATREAKTA